MEKWSLNDNTKLVKNEKENKRAPPEKKKNFFFRIKINKVKQKTFAFFVIFLYTGGFKYIKF